jgi:hypothetical protein
MSDDLPIACTLTREALDARRAGLLPGLATRAEAREPTADGVRLRFAPSSDTLRDVVGMIDAERQCCRFLRFDLTVEPGEGPMWLGVSGPPGPRAFLDALLGVR